MATRERVLVLVEAIDRIDEIRQYDERRIVALTPPVSFKLECAGIPHVSLANLISSRELDALGCEHLARLEAVTAALDGRLREAVTLAGAPYLNVGSCAWYELKLVMNSLGFRALVLSRLLDSADELRFIGPRSGKAKTLLESGSLWGPVSELAARHSGRAYQNAAPQSVVTNRRPHWSWIPRGLRPRLGSLVRAARVLGLRDVVRRAPGAATEQLLPRVLIFSPGDANVKFVLNHAVRTRGFCPMFIGAESFDRFERWEPVGLRWRRTVTRLPRTDEREAGASAARAHQMFVQDSQFRALWCDGGINYCDLVAPWIEDLVCRRSLQMAEVARRAEVAARGSDLALGEVMGSMTAKAAAAGVQHAGRPMWIYRHGSSLGHLTMETGVAAEERRNDAERADALLCWGEQDAQFFRRWCGSSALAVGSAHLDALRRAQRTPDWQRRRREARRRLNIRGSDRCVVYVLQNMARNIITTPHRYRLPEVEWRIERRIIETVATFPGVVLVARLHPDPAWTTPPVAELARHSRLANVRVSRDRSHDWLAIGDLFISDFPTTSFLEMLTTATPVFVCGEEMPPQCRPGDWSPALRAMWLPRVTFRETLAGFLEALRIELQNPSPAPDDDALLRAFGTHVDDGRSAERVCQLLANVPPRGSTPPAEAAQPVFA